jgi:hypothetical protein
MEVEVVIYSILLYSAAPDDQRLLCSQGWHDIMVLACLNVHKIHLRDASSQS